MEIYAYLDGREGRRTQGTWETEGNAVTGKADQV